MYKSSIYFTSIILLLLTVSINELSAQVIQSISPPILYSPNIGGARILRAQGNTAASPAIGFTGSNYFPANVDDTGGGNGIFRPTFNTMAFATLSTERMRINASGQLCINTISPMGRVTINGDGKDDYLVLPSTPGGFQWGYNRFGNDIYDAYWSYNTQMQNNVWYVDKASNNACATRITQAWGGIRLQFYKYPGTSGPDNGFPNWTVFSKTAWNNAISIDAVNGQVHVGLNTQLTGANADYKLSVDGKIVAKEIVVTASNWAAWPDYVFDNNYSLMPLTKVEQYIGEHKHLPNMPAATEIASNGANVGEIQSKLLQKIEELTLYLIDLQKANKTLEEKISTLEQRQ